MNEIDEKGIITYINETSESFSEVEFNELDGMVMSLLSYAEFEKADWGDVDWEKGISLAEYAEKLKDYVGSDDRKLLEAIINSNRYKDCIVRNPAACNGNNLWDNGEVKRISEDSQWAAITIVIDDDPSKSVVAFRGTNATELGWYEDCELGFDENGNTAQRLSRDYLEGCEEDEIIAAGHSKGGNDGTSGYMLANDDTRKRVKKIYNYDGPGHNAEFIERHKDAYNELEEKEKNYYPKDSIVGQLIDNNPGENHFLDSYAGDIMAEHELWNDKVVWNEEKGTYEFIEVEQTPFSKEVDKIIDHLLSGMSTQEKEAVIKVIMAFFPYVISKIGRNEEITEEDVKYLLGRSLVSGDFDSLDEIIPLINALRLILKKLIEYGYIKSKENIVVEPLFLNISDWYASKLRRIKDRAEEIVEKVTDSVSGTKRNDSGNGEVYSFKKKKRAKAVAKNSYFQVDTERLIRAEGEMSKESTDLRTMADEIMSVAKTGKYGGTCIPVEKIHACADDLYEMIDIMETYTNSLGSMANRYNEVERGIIDI